MEQPRRKCRLADSEHKDIDLRKFENEIINTINSTVPGKNPQVHKSYYSTDPLTQSEAVALGRALSKIDTLKDYGKTVTIFRLFDGKTYESEESNTPLKVAQKAKKNDSQNEDYKPKINRLGGRVR